MIDLDQLEFESDMELFVELYIGALKGEPFPEDLIAKQARLARENRLDKEEWG